MAILEEVLALDDRKVEEVPVAEWGGTVVRLMEMSAADRDDWELDRFNIVKSGARVRNVRAGLVARCWVDKNGERVVPDDRISELGKKSAKVLDRLFDVCQRLNALTAGEVKEVEKN